MTREPGTGTGTGTSGLPAAWRGIAERFGPILATDEPLDRHTTMRVGGPARMFLMPRTLEETSEVVAALDASGVPVFVLGGGSNLLIRDEGFSGAVVNLSALASVRASGERLRCGAGAPLARVAKYAMRAGLSGMEGLVGIPGTVGGAVFMNAGGRHGEIADVVEWIAAVDRQGRLLRLSRDDIRFRYRGSGLGGLVVVEATLSLAAGDGAAICGRMAEILKRKHQTQPMGQRSAGCIFKNPAPERAAAMLIDRAGLKGERAGGCEVSRRHANFIVNDREARAADVFALIERVRGAVLERHGTALGLEVQVLGSRGLEAA